MKKLRGPEYTGWASGVGFFYTALNICTWHLASLFITRGIPDGATSGNITPIRVSTN